ncbi:MAG TPA: aromatic ring-hydroxylating dioxygenase subunit alpha [Spongiibacteraceae bacterium]
MIGLRNIWYIAAWDYEVTERPVERIILEKSVVVFRAADGSASVLDNACPHRFAPLSRGRVIAGNIECAYHGLRFNSDGKCIHNPHPNGCGPIPPALCVRKYPVVERHCAIWVWMGDKVPDETLIPDYHYIDDTENYRTFRGVFELDSHYWLGCDNALDLTHVTYVHAGGLGGGADNVINERRELVRDGNSLWCKRYNDDIVAGPDFRRFNPALNDIKVDKQQNVRWDPPGNILIVILYTKANEPDACKTSVYAGNMLCPVSDTKTRFHWSVSRDFALDSDKLDDAMRAVTELALIKQDKAMIEDQLTLMGTIDIDELNPVYIQDDVLPLRAKMTLDAMIKTESQERVDEALNWRTPHISLTPA